MSTPQPIAPETQRVAARKSQGQPAEDSGAESFSESSVIRAIKELTFGTVEVVVHQGRISEIRQTRRFRATKAS